MEISKPCNEPASKTRAPDTPVEDHVTLVTEAPNGSSGVRVGSIAAFSDDVVSLATGTPWQVPWELLMLGPFGSCVLHDNGLFRHVTALAMVRSAMHRLSKPDDPLFPSDYEILPSFSPEVALIDAARSAMETGWNVAVVRARELRMITADAVFRGLVRSEVRSTRAVFDPIRQQLLC